MASVPFVRRAQHRRLPMLLSTVRCARKGRRSCHSGMPFDSKTLTPVTVGSEERSLLGFMLLLFARQAGNLQPAPQMIARAAASGRRAHHRCRVLGCPCRIDFSRADARLMASSGRATSMSFLRVAVAVTSCPIPAGRPTRSPSAARCRRGGCIPALAPRARGSHRG